MCQECGCSQPGPYHIDGRPVSNHPPTHTPADGTVHSHGHGATPGHDHAHPHQILQLNTGILGGNDRIAERNRGAFRALQLLALNVVSSPGAGKTALLTRTTEGEDKPLKYPPMFHSADVVIVTKTDMTEAAGFDRELALKNIQQAAPHAKVFTISSRSGDGMKAWCDHLVALHTAAKT